MITDLVIDLFMSLADVIVNLLPEIPFIIADDVFRGSYILLRYIAYFLPVVDLMPILVLSVALKNTALFTAIVYRVKSFIPTMGH